MNNTRIFLGAIFIIAVYWILTLYEPFLISIAAASLLAIATANFYTFTLNFTKSDTMSSIISTFLLSLLFFAPMTYFLTKLAPIIGHMKPEVFHAMLEKARQLLDEVPSSLDFLKPIAKEAIESIDLSVAAGNILQIAAKVGSLSAEFIKAAVLVLIFYFFANLYGKKIVIFFKNMIPMDPKNSTRLMHEITNVMGIVFYSILTTAIFEGALFAILALFMDYNAFLLLILYGFASLIPIIGGMLMWVPLSLYELSIGHTTNAIIIALYSVIVISIIADTFIKPIIIKYINITFIKAQTHMNEIFIFFAIIAGLSSFGFWGMIFGPAITAFFLALLHLFEILKAQEKIASD